ncbi:hypothetical protein LSPH24S_00427 [Lysinibacillus sphaericus]
MNIARQRKLYNGLKMKWKSKKVIQFAFMLL